jgi:hypothetical protein
MQRRRRYDARALNSRLSKASLTRSRKAEIAEGHLIVFAWVYQGQPVPSVNSDDEHHP